MSGESEWSNVFPGGPSRDMVCNVSERFYSVDGVRIGVVREELDELVGTPTTRVSRPRAMANGLPYRNSSAIVWVSFRCEWARGPNSRRVGRC